MGAPFVRVEGLAKTYLMGDRRLEVLQRLDLEIQAGELVALTGPSGAGKSTFLHVLGTLDAPSAGRVLFDGEDVFARGDEDLATFRNATVGFVFQSHHLLPEFTALENAMMPALIRRRPRAEARARAEEVLDLVGLAARLHHRPGELSGGEQQRVALARALALRPRLLLADEPTGNLDRRSGEDVMRILEDLNRRGITLVVVTHDPEIAGRARRRVRMLDGRIAEDARS
jgi:lipoprotein-releasing system ATP-binding protein